MPEQNNNDPERIIEEAAPDPRRLRAMPDGLNLADLFEPPAEALPRRYHPLANQVPNVEFRFMANAQAANAQALWVDNALNVAELRAVEGPPPLDLDELLTDTLRLATEWADRASPFLASNQDFDNWLDHNGLFDSFADYAEHVRYYGKECKKAALDRGVNLSTLEDIRAVDVARALISINFGREDGIYAPLGLAEPIREPKPYLHIAFSWRGLLNKNQYPITRHENAIQLFHHMKPGESVLDKKNIMELLLYMPLALFDGERRKPSIVLNPYHSKPVPLP